MAKGKFSQYVGEFLKQVREYDRNALSRDDVTSRESVNNVGGNNEIEGGIVRSDGTIRGYLRENFSDIGSFWRNLKNGRNSPILSLVIIAVLIIGLLCILLAPQTPLQSSKPDWTNTNSVDNSPPDQMVERAMNILEQQGLSASPQDSVCGLEPGDISFDASVQSDNLMWDSTDNMRVPISRTYGGMMIKGGINVCFQFSAQGAALAAINHLAALQNPSQYTSAIKYAVLNTGNDFKTSDDNNVFDQENVYVSFVGYKLTNTYPNATSVDIAFIANNGSDNATMHITVPVKWNEGDWKLETRDGELKNAVVSPINSTNGYTMLSDTK